MLPLHHCPTCMWQASKLALSFALSSYNFRQVTVGFPSVFIAQLASQTVVLGHKAGLDSRDGDQTAPDGVINSPQLAWPKDLSSIPPGSRVPEEVLALAIVPSS